MKKGQVWFQCTQPISRRNRSAADELTTGLVLFPEFFSSKPLFPKKKKRVNYLLMLVWRCFVGTAHGATAYRSKTATKKNNNNK